MKKIWLIFLNTVHVNGQTQNVQIFSTLLCKLLCSNIYYVFCYFLWNKQVENYLQTLEFAQLLNAFI